MANTWDKIGAIWVNKQEPDAAGNTPQYLLGSLRVGNRTIKFAAHPNPNKDDAKQPDFIMFMKPQAK